MIAHVDELRREIRTGPESQEADDGASPLPNAIEREAESPLTDRYEVNVLVDNREQPGAPVVAESHPTYYNLLGRVEYQPRFGAMVTDYRMIKPGALHRANGGYLLLNATDLLRNPFTWDVLKRALRTGTIQIENIGEQFSPIPAATLRPEPIPLNVKVVLIGPPLVYHLLFLPR
jgi:predicted ATP-dependent protease